MSSVPNLFTNGILSIQYKYKSLGIIGWEVKRMKRLWKKVAQWVHAYGVQGAGTPSLHGIYEAPVPKALHK